MRLQRLFNLMACMGLLTLFLGCASPQKKEAAGQYVDDSVVTTKVKAAIFRDPTLKATQVNVETYQGVVQLSGFVDSQDNVTRAGDVARTVEGVKSVKNDLVVKPK